MYTLSLPASKHGPWIEPWQNMSRPGADSARLSCSYAGARAAPLTSVAEALREKDE
jgi:hypothetical protein